LQGVDNFRGSKYVQSDTAGVYRLVRADLLKKMIVLFSGTPCQIAAVREVCKDCLDNLVCVEILCHGVPSPKLFATLLDEMRGEENKSIEFDKFEFRDKSRGWRAKTVQARKGDSVFPGGTAAAGYMGAFMARMSIRECCENCAFNDGRSGADVTLGDFWGIERVAPELDDGTGSSLVILHTEKGRKLFNAIEVDKKVVDIYGAIRDNPSYRSKRHKNKKRDVFLKQVRDGFSIEAGFETAAHHGTLVGLVRRCKKVFIRLLNKI
jgi:coenzyme F420-reducing hydrogenase beta subunit